MSLRAIRRPLTAWVVICAMVFGVLAPLVGHATPRMDGGEWGDVCSAQGPRPASTADNTAPAKDPAWPGRVLHGCAMCLFLDLASTGLPPACTGSLPRPAVEPLPPLPAPLAAPAPAVWPGALSRAPPTS